jgi:predicted permease
VELNRQPFTIVGVAPAGFRGTMNGLTFDFWTPVTMHQQVGHFGSLTERGDHWLHAQAMLQRGVSRAQAQLAVGLMSRQLQRAYPGTNRELDVRVLPVWKAPYGGQAVLFPVLRILLAVSVGVLLIVAANVANLLLARAASREKEIAIRLAVGAGKARLVRQLLTESTLLALCGGVMGAVFAQGAAGLLKVFLPKTYLPVELSLDLNWHTLGFTLVVTLLTGLIFGLAPALQAARLNLNDTLKEGGRTSGPTFARHALRRALVVAEVALALLLVIGAGLCLKGLQKARQIDFGFDPANVLFAGLRLGAHGYEEPTAKVFYRQLRERLAALPGVQEAALASWFPLGFEGGSGTSAVGEGYQPAPNEDLGAQFVIVTPRYFAAMRIPIVEGREFTEQDDGKQGNVAIINETMARRFWPGQSAIGRKLRLFGNSEASVVGVVKNGKYRSLNEPLRSFMYLPYQQGVWDLNLGVVLRTSGNPAAWLSALRQEVHAMDRGVEPYAILSALEYVQPAFLAQRIAATLLTLLGVVALVLAAMGIYGVLAYVVSQRTHEVGVRMVLGASTGNVLGLMLKHGMGMAVVGISLGAAGALALTRWLSSFLYGVSPFDPAVFLAVCAMVGSICLAACYVPARRAAGVDPIVALRYE